MKSIVFGAAALSLAACAAVAPQKPAPYTFLRTERPGPDYRAYLTKPFEGHAQGGQAVTRQVKLFGKATNENGVLALCGFYTVEMLDTSGRASSEGPDRIIREQLSSPNSTLLLDGEIVGDLSFLRPYSLADGEVRANCVATRLPWRESYAKAKVAYHWPPLSLHNG
jgi:hypothetical protein